MRSIPRNRKARVSTAEEERQRYLALLLRLGERFDQGPLRQIYCNRDLPYERVRWIGFDMDYTLAVYHQEALDALSHRLTVHRLVERYGYPPQVAEIPFRGDFAIRGLTVDHKTGHILKLDAQRQVDRALHGFQPVAPEQLVEYRHRPPVLSSKRFRLIDTLFELPEAYLFAAMIELLEPLGVPLDYARLADEIRTSIDSIHADGSLKSVVMADLPTYIRHDPKLGDTLHRFRSAGKKLFLMTNSYVAYTESVMAYLLQGGPKDYPNWRTYFDVIVTGASKPRFFTEQAPFLTLSDTGDVVGEERVALRRGVPYQHGNLRDFERMTDVRADEVLYVGDHIYGDILRSKRDSAWRTCMIIPEMEHELRVGAKHADAMRRWSALEAELHQIADALALETEFRFRMEHDPELVLREGMSDAFRAECTAAFAEVDRNSDRLRRRQRALIEAIRQLEPEIERDYHPIWGPLFKAGNEHSMFGEQVESYADLYTSRVTNFLAYSPTMYQRASRDWMAHEAAFVARIGRGEPAT
jgi:5'-nucleotidase